ncbi:MAG TPA: ATP-binding protein, partial [Xanthobacteraceae bacterium]|nr:ATP-binding protein [Xanthobacteraceae bacterium]
AAITIADSVPECLIGDPVRLRAALENLLDNALKFTDQGAVELELRAEPAKAGRVRLHCIVRDTGIGLTRGEIKRLFRPFTQASSEIARRYGGAGVGLSIVKTLAKRMGGDLTVASTPGRGSAFQFTAVLPIARDDAVAAALPSQRR